MNKRGAGRELAPWYPPNQYSLCNAEPCRPRDMGPPKTSPTESRRRSSYSETSMRFSTLPGAPWSKSFRKLSWSFDPEPPPQRPRKSRSLSKAVDERDRRDCMAIARGRTFTTWIDRDLMKIVIRGRQLSLTIFDAIPKQRTAASPYELKPARTHASTAAGALPVSARAPVPGAEPEFRPPPLDAQSEGRPSRRNGNGTPTAKTSLRTGRLIIECASSRAAVYVDGAYYGSCPLELPIVAGAHSITVRRPRTDDWVREVDLQAGKTLRVRAR